MGKNIEIKFPIVTFGSKIVEFWGKFGENQTKLFGKKLGSPDWPWQSSPVHADLGLVQSSPVQSSP